MTACLKPQFFKKTAMKIKVKNSGFIKLKSFGGPPNGRLTFGETGEQIPFPIKRFYVVSDLLNDKIERGKHAHKQTEQYIFCLRGKFVLHLDDGKTKQKITLNSPDAGVFLGKMLWHSMSRFSKDCLILVVASRHYQEKDYIRNYEEFKKLAKHL